jgi:hypothetical protein
MSQMLLFWGVPNPLKHENKTMARQRTKPITFWLSDSEALLFNKKVESVSSDKSAYIRKCVLDKKITVIPGIKDLTIELKRIGNNLNQLTRAVHEGSLTILGDDLKNIKEDIGQVWEQLGATLKKI